jgi:hypothetical protein
MIRNFTWFLTAAPIPAMPKARPKKMPDTAHTLQRQFVDPFYLKHSDHLISMVF